MSSIKLNDVCLDYIVITGSDSVKKVVLNTFYTVFQKNNAPLLTTKNSTYRALNNISIEFSKGDRVALLGRNGAGKSTLLRVLAKIYKPNAGSIQINGKISGLFDIGLGINPEATGYENIINLAILRGFTKKRALSIVPDVESFTELKEFLNAPIRTYSSGMQMKLAFAVATAITPEILLLDEVIGVGDAHFMKKAVCRMQNAIESSDILVLTSHSEDIVRQFCNKVVVLERGEVRFFGDMQEGLDVYKKILN